MIGLVLLDRDGVLNRDRADSVKNPAELEMLPGAAEAVARLNRAGIKVAVVTNQSCVGRGMVSAAMLDRIHEKLHGELAGAGARLDALLVCPDHPERPSERRKPAPGMLREAMRQFSIAPGQALMIGDDLRDLQAARAAGCARVLVRTGKGADCQRAGIPADLLPVSVRADLADAVEHLLVEPRP